MIPIKSVVAREIIDSRSNPTVEATITLSDGSIGTSSVPEGASKGKYEAVEIRDNDMFRYRGQGVLTAVNNISTLINKQLSGKTFESPQHLDQLLIDLDGTPDKSKLGSNSILPVSMAYCEAVAKSQNIPLYLFLNQLYNEKHEPVSLKIPQPTYNLINGGKHGVGNNVDFQEYHLVFSTKYSYSDSLRMASEVFHRLSEELNREDYWPVIGDEGGYSPNLPNNEAGLKVIVKAAEINKLKLGEDYNLGLDLAASSFLTEKGYRLERRIIKPKDLLNLYDDLVSRYQISFLEDPFAEEDYRNWSTINVVLDTIMIIADDLICTNVERIKQAVKLKACSAALIKPNQIGTISETFAAIDVARQNGLKIIVSHRSGETEEDFIADLAVGVAADMVKFGAPNRGERTVKYNRLLAIDQDMSAT